MYLDSSSTALGVLARNPLGQPTSPTLVFTGVEQQAVKVLINQEVHNENALTDTVFFRRHPRRRGAALLPSEKREWITIRDQLARPLLAAVQPNIPPRLCCMFGPSPAKFIHPSKLGAHKDSATRGPRHRLHRTCRVYGPGSPPGNL